MPKNAYIHIPFCKSKCRYCSFVSYPKLEMKEKYLNTLLREIDFFYKNENLNTLYIGGGTPSLLSCEEIAMLVNSFNFEDNAEVTIELNPETLTKEYFEGLKSAGINRISMGCQTFDDDILKLIGRRHNSNQVKSAVKTAQDCGFENISLDFIYGLPSQTAEGFFDDLTTAVSLGIKHISLYGLKIDEGCYFYNNSPQNLPDDDEQADMYLKAVEIMRDAGFEHYEISNFSKHGLYSRHNMNYWDNNSYYGFGIAAHGYENGARYSNFTDFESYLKNPLIHLTNNILTKQEKLEEEIFLGFRRMAGINVQSVNEKFSIDFESDYSDVIKKYISTGFLSKTEKGYRLTLNGVLVSNVVLSEFLH